VQGFLANKELTQTLLGVVTNNMEDLTNFLLTGKSPKYDTEKFLGQWEFNPNVSVAWWRQSQPKVTATEMRAVRALMTQAYGQTKIMVTGDNQIFVRNLPRAKKQADPNSGPELGNWKGDWNRDGTNYNVHLTLNGEEKFFTATVDGIRLSIKDGRNLLIFDRAN
jgi:hypothetical protein